MPFATQLCNRAEERVSQSECQTARQERVANFSGEGNEDDEDEVSECALGIYEVQRSACTCTLHREKKKKKMDFGTAAASLILLLAAPSQTGAQYFNPEFVSPAPRGGNRELHLAGYSVNNPSVQVNGSTGR